MGGVGDNHVELEQVNWADVGERLVAYALWLLQHRLGFLGRFDDIGLGRSVEDLACEVVADVIDDRCGYDPGKGGLVPFLKRRLKWRLLNLLGSSANRIECLMPGAGERLACNGYNRANIEAFVDLLRRRIDEFQAERKRKFDLHVMLDCILSEPDISPQRLAEKLSLEQGQIYYQLRLLRCLTLGLKQGGEDENL